MSYKRIFTISNFQDQSGLPITGTMGIYYAGSTNLASVFSDSAGTIVRTNPIRLTPSGDVGDAYVDDSHTYKIVVMDSEGTVRLTKDNVEVSGVDIVETTPSNGLGADLTGKLCVDTTNNAFYVGLGTHWYPITLGTPI